MDLKKYNQQVIETLQKLIRIKTVKSEPVENGPFGLGNKQCLETTLQICQELGFKVKNLDGYCGYAEIGTGSELVGIIGHLDVVPEGEGWKYDPYGGEIVDNELWGRGTWDDKGPIVVSIYAIKALMDSGYHFNKRVRIIFGCDEESGSACMEHYLKIDEPITYGVTPDASFPVIFAEKSINNIELSGLSTNKGDVELISLTAGIVINAVPDKCEFTLRSPIEKQKEIVQMISHNLHKDDIKFDYEIKGSLIHFVVHGKAAHGSTPHLGINAASYGVCALHNVVKNDFVDFYFNCIGHSYNGTKLGCYCQDEYGDLASNIGLVKYENGDFSIKINSRLPFNTSTEKMMEEIKEKIKSYTFVSLKLLSASNGFKMDEKSLMIKALVQAYQEVTKDYISKPICCAGGTYAREFKNCVAFGPEMEGYGEIIIHQPNERIQLRALEDLLKIYIKAYKSLVEL